MNLRVPLDVGISLPIERVESTALQYFIVRTFKTVPKPGALVWKTLKYCVLYSVLPGS